MLSALAVPALVLAACGQPSGQIITPNDGPVSFGLPATYTDLGPTSDRDLGQVYGLPTSPVDSLSNDPVVFLGTMPSGSAASFSSLRMLSTYNEFDPLDESLDPLPNSTQVLGYTEIAEADVWGVRIRLAVDQGASDFQALVERESGEITVSRVICTQACFIEQVDLIDEIQRSWSLEQ